VTLGVKIKTVFHFMKLSSEMMYVIRREKSYPDAQRLTLGGTPLC